MIAKNKYYWVRIRDNGERRFSCVSCARHLITEMGIYGNGEDSHPTFVLRRHYHEVFVGTTFISTTLYRNFGQVVMGMYEWKKKKAR